MTIEVTQFHMPNGRKTQEITEVSDECKDGYESMRRCGCRLTAEILSTGVVSCTIEHPEGDFDIEITPNGPEVIAGLERMLKQFDAIRLADWIHSLNED